MGFTREELLAFTGAEVPDLAGPGMRLLLAGINPGLHSAAVRAHFARRGNRFWPALAAAGVLPHVVDCHDGMKPEDEQLVLERGVGISNIGRRATARADQLTADELRSGALLLRKKVRAWRPDVVAILGLTAYRTAFGAPRALAGEQAGDVEGARLWVLPSPSGLNAHETLASLAAAYAEPARAAGLLPASAASAATASAATAEELEIARAHLFGAVPSIGRGGEVAAQRQVNGTLHDRAE